MVTVNSYEIRRILRSTLGEMRQQLLLFFCVTIVCGDFRAQSGDIINIIPNPGFEQYSSVPLGWFYTGSDFTRVVKYWGSPTAASPDVYGPKVYVPSEWKEQGFGQLAAHEGKSMVGITLFGCEGGKPHCREYIQVQLIEPLVVGQRYQLRMMAAHLPLSMRTRNLEVAFSSEQLKSTVDARLDLMPVVMPERVLDNDGGWIEIVSEFVALEASEYIVIGNFHSDEETQVKPCTDLEALSFAYYYLDDLSLLKMPPILDAPEDPDDLSKVNIEAGKLITLNNIYFDHDRNDFLPRSFRELNTLVEIMNEYPSMRIEIHGHTDNVGTDDYNYQLSLSRAYAVVEYLTERGIDSNRASARGYGSEKPISSNSTDEGRQRNRRVEFLILSK